MEYNLRYGCNPHQLKAKLIIDADPSPLEILNGSSSYINILDSLAAWQLARELDEATGKPGAASFKHVSPAGAAVAGSFSDEFRVSQFLPAGDYSPIATAYARARGGDRMCSYGDAAAVSRIVDTSLARLLKAEVCDSIIAPGFEPEALEMLKTKQKGRFLIFRISPDYQPPEVESREVFGFRLQQQRNNTRITKDFFRTAVTRNKTISDGILETLVVGTIALKYTQSNSVCVAYDGQVVGMGAGQQSRVHCTRLACSKADKWFLQQHSRVTGLPFRINTMKPEKANLVDQFLLWDELSEHERSVLLSGLQGRPEPFSSEEKFSWIKNFNGICLSSDAFIPFRDNMDRASRTNVQYVAHAGGAVRDEDVTKAADEYGMVVFHTGLRLFTH